MLKLSRMKSVFFQTMAFAVLAMCNPARAEEAKIQPGACVAGVEKFCGAADPDEDRTKDCPKELSKNHVARLKSDGCRARTARLNVPAAGAPKK